MKTLKDLRLEKCFSIRDLANAAGVSPTTIQNIESGIKPVLRTKRKIAKALNVDPSNVDW